MKIRIVKKVINGVTVENKAPKPRCETVDKKQFDELGTGTKTAFPKEPILKVV